MHRNGFPIELTPIDTIAADDLRIVETPGGHSMLVASFDDGNGARVVAKIAITQERWDSLCATLFHSIEAAETMDDPPRH